MSKHTPTPWVALTRPEYDGETLGDGSVVGGPTGLDELVGVFGRDDLREADEQGVEPYPVCVPGSLADANRIVACVNACDGLSDEEVARLPLTVGRLVQQRASLLQAAEGVLAAVAGRRNLDGPLLRLSAAVKAARAE